MDIVLYTHPPPPHTYIHIYKIYCTHQSFPYLYIENEADYSKDKNKVSMNSEFQLNYLL